MQETAWRVYVTDSLFYQAQGKRLMGRYLDALQHKEQEVPDGDEIAADVIRRAGLVVADGSF